MFSYKRNIKFDIGTCKCKTHAKKYNADCMRKVVLLSRRVILRMACMNFNKVRHNIFDCSLKRHCNLDISENNLLSLIDLQQESILPTIF